MNYHALSFIVRVPPPTPAERTEAGSNHDRRFQISHFSIFPSSRSSIAFSILISLIVVKGTPFEVLHLRTPLVAPALRLVQLK